jgi:hypothetical protein
MRRLAALVRSSTVGLVFLAVLELAFRGLGLFDPTELRDPYLGFPGSAPLYRVEAGPQGGPELRTSPNKRMAYRDVRFPVAKDPSELRVFCIGGSSLQLESFTHPSAAFPDFLELYLGAAAPERRPRAINAGGGATGSVQNLEVLREYELSIRRHPLIELLREVARDKRVPLVDPFDALVSEAGGGAPGYELFVDSVHPYPAACRTIARSILEGLIAQHVLDDVRAPEPERLAEVEARCEALARESTELNTPIQARIHRAIRRGDLAEAVRWGETRPRAELLLDPVDLFYYGWALTLSGRLDEARALYDDSRALHVGADTRLPDLSTPEAMIEVAFNGDVFAFF